MVENIRVEESSRIEDKLGGKQDSKKLSCSDCRFHHWTNFCLHNDRPAYYKDLICSEFKERKKK